MVNYVNQSLYIKQMGSLQLELNIISSLWRTAVSEAGHNKENITQIHKSYVSLHHTKLQSIEQQKHFSYLFFITCLSI